MNRIINSLAVAEFNRLINAVEISFKGQGPSSLYHETMDIAMDISLVHRSNQWLFKKKRFQDINHSAFICFVEKWATKASYLHQEYGGSEQCKVALYTTTESCLYLLSEYEWLQDSTTKLPFLHIQLFTDLNKAKAFLNKGYSANVLA